MAGLIYGALKQPVEFLIVSGCERCRVEEGGVYRNWLEGPMKRYDMLSLGGGGGEQCYHKMLIVEIC